MIRPECGRRRHIRIVGGHQCERKRRLVLLDPQRDTLQGVAGPRAIDHRSPSDKRRDGREQRNTARRRLSRDAGEDHQSDARRQCGSTGPCGRGNRDRDRQIRSRARDALPRGHVAVSVTRPFSQALRHLPRARQRLTRERADGERAARSTRKRAKRSAATLRLETCPGGSARTSRTGRPVRLVAGPVVQAAKVSSV